MKWKALHHKISHKLQQEDVGGQQGIGPPIAFPQPVEEQKSDDSSSNSDDTVSVEDENKVDQVHKGEGIIDDMILIGLKKPKISKQ